MSDLGDAAIRYARDLSWPVHPLRPSSKIPSSPHGCKDATVDLERIEKWWAKRPNDNIGLAAGHAFDVLDVDDWDAAIPTIHDLWEAAGRPDGFLSDEGAHGPATRTPSGGAHLLVAAAGLPNSTKRIPGLDVRGGGGFIVGPPSRDPRGVWAWVDGFGPDAPLPTAPRWLLDALRPAAPPARPALRVVHGGGQGAYGRRALEAEVGRVLLAQNGQRNDQLNRSAFSLGQLVGGGALDSVETCDALWTAATSAGLGATEAEATIRSGISRGLQSPRSAS